MPLPLLVKPLRMHHLQRLMLLAPQPMPLAPLLTPVPLLPTLLLLLLRPRKVPLLLQKRPSRNYCTPGDAMSPGVSAGACGGGLCPKVAIDFPHRFCDKAFSPR